MAGYERELMTSSRKRKSDRDHDGNLHKRREGKNNREMIFLINKDYNNVVPSAEIGDDLKNGDTDETPMTSRLKRRFESLFGDSQPTPSMIMKHKITAAGKRLDFEMNMCLPSSSSRQSVIAPLAADGKEKDATVKRMTSRLKRKFKMLFGDDCDDLPTIKKSKLDDLKASNSLEITIDEEKTSIEAFDSHDDKVQGKLIKLPTYSIDRRQPDLTKKQCRTVVPFAQKSKDSKLDLCLQKLIEEKEKVTAISARKASMSKESIVMRQRHLQRLKTLKLDENKSNDKINRGTILCGRSLDWKIPRIPDAVDSTTALWINEATSPLLGQIDKQPEKLLGWKIPLSKPRIDSGDDWSKYG